MATKNAAKASKSTKEDPKSLSLAAMWDDTDESEASNFLPEGEHEARLNGLELKKNDKGTAVFATYECLEGDNEGKTARQMYKLTDSSGEKGPGHAYLKRDLRLLGYEDVPGAKLEKVLKEISEEQPMVIIKCVKNGEYFNCYLQGSAENPSDSEKDEDEEEESEDFVAKVGDKVKWEEDGEEKTGTVTKIKKGVATVEDEDDDDFQVEVGDLSAADEDEPEEEEDEEEEEEEEAPKIEKGSKVKWTDDEEDEHTGVVKAIKGDTAKVLDDDSEKKVDVDIDDLELADDEE